MSYFAKVESGLVTRVIKAESSFFDNFKDSSPGSWIQTSYNTRGGVHYDQAGKPSTNQSKALRKNYAGVGFTYDAQRDAFIPPKPFPSWKLNDQTCQWDAPTAIPKDGKMYEWNETTKKWEVNNG